MRFPLSHPASSCPFKLLHPTSLQHGPGPLQPPDPLYRLHLSVPPGVPAASGVQLPEQEGGQCCWEPCYETRLPRDIYHVSPCLMMCPGGLPSCDTAHGLHRLWTRRSPACISQMLRCGKSSHCHLWPLFVLLLLALTHKITWYEGIISHCLHATKRLQF